MTADPLRIAIADDEPRTCDYYRGVLERLGHSVVGVAHDGRALVALCRQQQPQLVVTDVKMPDTDGIWAAEVLDESCAVPVILISAYDEPDLINLTSATNITSFLVKPVKPQDLKMAIAVARRKLHDSRRE